MKFNFLLGTVAMVTMLSACGDRIGADAGTGDGTHEPNNDNGVTGGSTGNGLGDTSGTVDGQAGATSDGDAGVPTNDQDAGTGGTKGSDAGEPHNDGHGKAGMSSGSAGRDAGTATDDDHDAGTPSDNGEAGATDDDGEAGASASGGSGGSGGLSNAGGSGGLPASGGSGDVSTSGGSAGLSNAGGSAGLASSGGSAGLPGSGGSDAGGSGGLPGSGGSGGTSETGGSGGLPGSGGSTAASGGSAGSSAASAGTGGSAGSGGTSGSGGSGGDDNSSLDPKYLFTEATFGGNGRTCVTCHTAATGTISPAEIQSLYTADPNDPMFRPIDSDDGASNNYTLLEARATFRVSINLPASVHLVSDPTATSVVFRRGVPTTINTPALDPNIMWDGREPSLTSQALDAILGHAQGTVTPTPAQLDLIAEFEQGADFFSNDTLRQYAQGGPEPTWPPGVSDAEQRGRRWFAQDSAAPRFNICGQCHGGPMANETQSNSGLPVGQHFQTVNVSEFNEAGNPTYQFTFPDPKNAGQTVTVTTPDPGRALITGDVRDLNFFKIPPLWGIKNTAPYFHDNSAATLEDLVNHYEKHLATFLPKNATYPRPHVPTTQDKADIVAYLKLL